MLCKLYISNASLFTQNSNPVVMCLKLILAGIGTRGVGGGGGDQESRNSEEGFFNKKFLEKNVKSNVNILVF